MLIGALGWRSHTERFCEGFGDGVGDGLEEGLGGGGGLRGPGGRVGEGTVEILHDTNTATQHET